MALDLANLSAEDRIALMNFMKGEMQAETEAKKVARKKTREFVANFVGIVARTSGVAEQTFKSGASGWSLGGKDVEVVTVKAHRNAEGIDMPDVVRKARVSILIRWEDTIPATEKAATSAKTDAKTDEKSDDSTDAQTEL